MTMPYASSAPSQRGTCPSVTTSMTMPAPRICRVMYGTKAMRLRRAMRAERDRDGKRPVTSCAWVAFNSVSVEPSCRYAAALSNAMLV